MQSVCLVYAMHFLALLIRADQSKGRETVYIAHVFQMPTAGFWCKTCVNAHTSFLFLNQAAGMTCFVLAPLYRCNRS